MQLKQIKKFFSYSRFRRFTIHWEKIPEIMDSSFREIIYSSSQYSKYRIMYYISENTDTIYILYVINSKQNFNHILKLHNYFK